MRTFALIYVLLIGTPSISQNQLPVPKGLVLEPNGQPIKGAFVLLRDYEQTDAEYVSDRWEGRTAADGSFSFAAPSGCYDLFISANPRFLPLTQRVCVQPERGGLKIKLKADPHPKLLIR
jgi:hypothetical protein